MERFERSRNLFGMEITAAILCLDQGIHVSIYGGDRPHIGAVTVGTAPGAASTTQFPGHRDAAVSQRWADALLERGFSPVVVEAGIHYDHLSKAGIQAVLACTEKVRAECFALLSGPGDRKMEE